MILKKTLTFSKDDYLRFNVKMLTLLINIELTEREVDVLAAFISFKDDIKKDLFGATVRKWVRDKLNLSPSALSNHLNALISKKLIKSVNDELLLHDILKTVDSVESYNINIVNNETLDRTITT